MSNPRRISELMDVRDSIAHGIRSLSINHEFVSRSYPRLIPEIQDWDFRVPDFPRPARFDLEAEAGQLSVSSVLKLNRRLDDNLKAWHRDLVGNGKPSQQCFDNLAIGGVDMREFQTFRPGNLAAAPYYHCWHNDGTYQMGSEGKALNLRTSNWDKYRERLKDLDQLPREIDTIVVFLFPKLSAVAKLSPIGPVVDGYAHAYETQFPFCWKRISGKTLRKIDDDLKWMNWRIRQTIAKFQSESRFRVIETYEIFGKYDFKNLGGNERLVTSGSQTIDNRYLHWQRRPRPPRRGNRPRGRVKVTFEHGGFQSLDGMQPTGIGYVVLAKEVMKALNPSYDKDALMTAAFKRERTRGLTRGLRGYDDFSNLLEALDLIMPDRDSTGFSLTNLIGIGHQSRF